MTVGPIGRRGRLGLERRAEGLASAHPWLAMNDSHTLTVWKTSDGLYLGPTDFICWSHNYA